MTPYARYRYRVSIWIHNKETYVEEERRNGAVVKPYVRGEKVKRLSPLYRPDSAVLPQSAAYDDLFLSRVYIDIDTYTIIV